MTAYPVKSALLRYPDGREVMLLLTCQKQPRDGEGGQYAWLDTSGREWEMGTVYDEEARAMKQLRVLVETDPGLVGVQLTIKPILPPAERRIAQKVITRYALPPKALDDLQEIVARESNLSPLIDAAETLIAYCFRHRAIFAQAMFPVVDGRLPRDVTFDGVLLTIIEELEKSKGQEFGKLKAILSEPVSAIVTPASNVGQKGSIQ